MRVLASVLARIAILGGLAAGAWFGLHALPDAINPFSPIELTDPVGPLTNVKLRLLQPRYEACLATLRRRDVGIVRDQIVSPVKGCGMAKGVRLSHAMLSHGGDLRMTCGLAAALLIWERQVVIPQSIAILGSPVVRVRHYGTYVCRNVNHAKMGKVSEHAKGRAIDIAGFDLADGRHVRVTKDWGKPTPEGAFLTAVHDGACRVFNVVLGPDYNAFHKTHFHFGMSVWSSCH
jgi:hypothetical protein